MLTLTETQWQSLQQGEVRQLIVVICDEFLANRPEMRESPGRALLLTRMRDAYDYAIRAGFTSTPHIVRLMHLSADAPRIHDDPLLDRYLSRPGATPEQRLDDLVSVMKHKLKGEG